MENKINIACFKEGSRTAEVKDIWQWDYGQILRIQGLNLPTAVEIHFSLDEHGGEAVRRIGVTKDGVTDVTIPDSMVENESAYGDSYYFFAYIYLTDETSGNTEYKIRAKVSTRSKPEGYVSGGNDTFAEILKTVNEIAEDKVDIPVPAKVGQVLAVKETDESGKPTEFEAKDMSGGVSDEKIAEAVGTYMESHPINETDPTVPEWAKQLEKPSYTALEVGADTAGTAVAKVSEHNTASNAHNDIRVLLQGLANRLNALADSDDTTLDQMSEVVAYIKSNKSLIDAITTSKVNVSDIIDNLTTNVSNKPLSAAQGVKLKALIDAIVVPTKLSELENDSGYAKTTDIPDKLPNPQKLTFAGAVTAEYDGSGAVTVTIPEGGGTGVTVDNTLSVAVKGGNEDYRPNYFTDDFKITEGIRINNGVESSNKSYFATDFLPIDGIISFADFYTPLYMNGIFFYDESRTYVGKASANDIPESAKYYRISDQIIGWKALYTTYGNVAGYGLNRYYRQLPKENGGIALANNVNLVDVISDPTKPTVTINFYGDSNTYGYGVEQKSWAYYIAQAIKANYSGEMKYYVGNPHIQAFCNMNTQASPYPALKGLTNQNIEDFPYIRIRTTATSVKVGWNGTGNGNLVIDGNYDDVRPVSNGDTVALDGALHVLDLKPSVANVMNYNPYFAISKTIVCNNYGAAGRTSQNQDITGLNTCDIAFMMIGTNDGNNSVWEGVQNSVLLQGVVNPSKLIGILPPANRANATLMRQIAHMKTLYDVIGVRYLRIPYFNELIAMDSTLMQSDGLHYTAKGHVALANAISSECGACVNVWDGAEYSTTVSDTFSNL